MTHEDNLEPTNQETITTDYVREVTARYIGPRRKSGVIHHAEMAARFMRKLIRDDIREHFVALYLDGKHHIVSCSINSIGTANHTTVNARELFQMAVLVGACAIIVGHNHPSGNLKESQSDIDVTTSLKDGALLLGIRLLDHIIFSDNAYLSMNESGIVNFDSKPYF